ncbi:MAG TPA: amidohydrolase family protein [Acidimicrobiales bacterium]|nr:amidohydrolase family protein [Acidimicrobiales bacterium]
MNHGYLPAFLQQRGTDEYQGVPYTDSDRAAIRSILASATEASGTGDEPWPEYISSKLGTARGLRALNETEDGDAFYDVPLEATEDTEAAAECFSVAPTVIDVQTHFMVDSDNARRATPIYHEFVRQIMPAWWAGLDSVTQYGIAEYLRCVFLESSTAVAVLSSAPTQEVLAPNEVLTATRELADRFGAMGRLLNHTVVDPAKPAQLEQMDRWAAAMGTVAWKVYTDPTVGGMIGMDSRFVSEDLFAWRLDDEVGSGFLDEVSRSNVDIICAHKGIGNHPAASPADVGPAAAAHPDLRFLVYHSGYVVPAHEGVAPEGPYERGGGGVDRLIDSVTGAGVGPGGNVYAEIGSTWFNLIRRPREAAHVLGKLLVAFGPDNVLWGTDSIWYGPPEPLVDAFRAFQIPVSMQEEFGYPALTDEVKHKVLAGNAASVYGIDLESARRRAESDDCAWINQVASELKGR